MCRHSGVVWTMGWRGKKHTCLQINWFGQEASKEELCAVKQACGEAGMSQQKHSHDHRVDHDAVHIIIISNCVLLIILLIIALLKNFTYTDHNSHFLTWTDKKKTVLV